MPRTDVMKVIRNKAISLSRKYGTPYEDLVQEGLLTVINVYKKYGPHVPNQILVEAVKHKFLNIRRYCHRTSVRFVPLNSMDEETKTDPMAEEAFRQVERNIDRQSLKKKLWESGDDMGCLIYELLLKGNDVKDISQAMDVTVTTVRKYLGQIKEVANG